MTVLSDIAQIKAAVEKAEQDAKEERAQRTLRSLRQLHELLAEKMAANADLLGLAEGDVTALGGGTPKIDPNQ